MGPGSGASVATAALSKSSLDQFGRSRGCNPRVGKLCSVDAAAGAAPVVTTWVCDAFRPRRRPDERESQSVEKTDMNVSSIAGSPPTRSQVASFHRGACTPSEQDQRAATSIRRRARGSWRLLGGVLLATTLGSESLAAAAPGPEAPTEHRSDRHSDRHSDRPPYRVTEIPAQFGEPAIVRVTISPSAIRARRLARGASLPEPSFFGLVRGGVDGSGNDSEGGIAGICPPSTVSHTGSNFGPGEYILQGGIVDDEIAAASYAVAPSQFPVQVTQGRILWGTSGASQPTTTEWSFQVFEGIPAAGVLVASFSSADGDVPPISLPPGTTGIVVQVDVDPSDPEQIFVNANASNSFSIAFRIDEHNQPSQVPCFIEPASCCNAFPAVDVDGLQQASQNWLFAISCPFGCPAGWRSFAQLGACTPSGDWVMNAQYIPFGCLPNLGACCLPSGNCLLLSSADCATQAGTYQGDGVSCLAVECVGFSGACCLPAGDCFAASPTECASAGGTYQGNNSICETANCTPAPGPCCFEATGGCLALAADICESVGGIAGPPGISCAGYVCFPEGACCLPDGSCAGDVTPEECAALRGTFQGDGTSCGSVNCPLPVGACCFGTGFCLALTEAECGLAGASWAGAGTTCADGNGNGTPDGCERKSGIPGDLNGDGAVNGADLGLLLGAWGGRGPADLNGDGVVDGADLGLILGAWTG